MHRAASRLLAGVLGAVAILTLLGFALKNQCAESYLELRDKALCSNDIQVLHSNRGLAEHRFPYVNGDFVMVTNPDGSTTVELVGGTLEYPVLTGLFAWFPALFVDSEAGYLRLTAPACTAGCGPAGRTSSASCRSPPPY